MTKIATFNVNGVNVRLSVLLRWLEEAQPDVICLQRAAELLALDVPVILAGDYRRRSRCPRLGKASDHAPVWIELSDAARSARRRRPTSKGG